VPGANDVVKRLVLGRALRSDRQSEQELPKHLALPIFASDPLSSVTYATQELLVVLTLGGLAYLYLTPYLAACVVVLLTVVVLSYRQLVKAYPTGGGDYEVASKNLGKGAGGVRVLGHMVGDVAVGPPLDHLELGPRPAARRLARQRSGRLLEPFAGAQHAPQPQDQEDRNAGQDQKLDDRRVHGVLAAG